MRTINRVIASVLIFSLDGKLLMGRKDPAKGGVYAWAWHLPGGGQEPDESLEDAARREAQQEVLGLDLSEAVLKPVPFVGRGEAPKRLETGEEVWCRMELNRFEVHLNRSAAQLEQALRPGDDLVELRWFSPNELSEVDQIPGGREFFVQAGYI